VQRFNAVTGNLGECRGKHFGTRNAALGHVFAAAAAASEFRQGFFHEFAQVARHSRGLREDERWLGRRRGQQRDCVRCKSSEFLREQLDEGKIAIGVSANDQLASTGLRGLGEQGCCVRRGEFFLRLVGLPPKRFDLFEGFARLLRHVVNVCGKKAASLGERGVVASRGGDGTLSGDKFDAPSLANFFCLAQQDAGDLPSVADVGTAASSEIEISNIY